MASVAQLDDASIEHAREVFADLDSVLLRRQAGQLSVPTTAPADVARHKREHALTFQEITHDPSPYAAFAHQRAEAWQHFLDTAQSRDQKTPTLSLDTLFPFADQYAKAGRAAEVMKPAKLLFDDSKLLRGQTAPALEGRDRVSSPLIGAVSRIGSGMHNPEAGLRGESSMDSFAGAQQAATDFPMDVAPWQETALDISQLPLDQVKHLQAEAYERAAHELHSRDVAYFLPPPSPLSRACQRRYAGSQQRSRAASPHRPGSKAAQHHARADDTLEVARPKPATAPGVLSFRPRRLDHDSRSGSLRGWLSMDKIDEDDGIASRPVATHVNASFARDESGLPVLRSLTAPAAHAQVGADQSKRGAPMHVPAAPPLLPPSATGGKDARTESVMSPVFTAASGAAGSPNRKLHAQELSMLLQYAAERRAEAVDSRTDMDNWVQEWKRDGVLPWAAAVVVKAWRRHIMRRRLMRYLRLRRRCKAIFVRPYFRSWMQYTLAGGLNGYQRQRAAFLAWRQYCTALDALSKKIILWAERSLSKTGGLHLTWRLCKTPGPEDGKRKYSTMLVQMLAMDRHRRVKRLAFARWQQEYRASKLNTRKGIHKLRSVAREHLISRVHLAFHFWRRYTRYKRVKRAGGVPPQWSDSFTHWHEWLQSHMRSQLLKEHAVVQSQAFRKRYLFNYWRFFLARNKSMRRAWEFADRNRDFLLTWNSFVAFKMNRQMAIKDNKMRSLVLRHWHATMRSTAEHRHLTLSTLMVSQRQTKAKVLRKFHEHMRACRALNAAATLQMWQRPVPVLTALAAWTSQDHQFWKLRVWSAWRGYATRRIRLAVLTGIRHVAPLLLAQQRTFGAWLAVTKASRASRQAHATHSERGTPAQQPTADEDDAAASSVSVERRDPQRSTQREAITGDVALDSGAHAEAPHEGGPVLVVRYMPKLPPLWREPLTKAMIMEEVPSNLQIKPARLAQKVLSVLSVKPGHCSERMLPTTYETQPTAADVSMLRYGRRLLTNWVHFQYADREIWQIAAMERLRRLPVSENPTLLTYTAVPEAFTQPVDFRYLPRCPVLVADPFKDCTPRMRRRLEREAALDRDSNAFCHKFDAAVDFLEAKLSGFFGIGAESTDLFYDLIAEKLLDATRPDKADLLVAVVAPLINHDRALLCRDRRAWDRRDKLLSTQLLLHHLAVQVNHFNPDFTLIDPGADPQDRWERLFLYEDSSTDDEGEEGASMYWMLPPPAGSLYKRTLRAFRRAHNRLSYIEVLWSRGYQVLHDLPYGHSSKGGQLAAVEAESDAGTAVTNGAVAHRKPKKVDERTLRQQAALMGDCKSLSLPLVPADADVAGALSGFVTAAENGVDIRWSSEEQAMLYVSAPERTSSFDRQKALVSTAGSELPPALSRRLERSALTLRGADLEERLPSHNEERPLSATAADVSDEPPPEVIPDELRTAEGANDRSSQGDRSSHDNEEVAGLTEHEGAHASHELEGVSTEEGPAIQGAKSLKSKAVAEAQSGFVRAADAEPTVPFQDEIAAIEARLLRRDSVLDADGDSDEDPGGVGMALDTAATDSEQHHEELPATAADRDLSLPMYASLESASGPTRSAELSTASGEEGDVSHEASEADDSSAALRPHGAELAPDSQTSPSLDSPREPSLRDLEPRAVTFADDIDGQADSGASPHEGPLPSATAAAKHDGDAAGAAQQDEHLVRQPFGVAQPFTRSMRSRLQWALPMAADGEPPQAPAPTTWRQDIRMQLPGFTSGVPPRPTTAPRADNPTNMHPSDPLFGDASSPEAGDQARFRVESARTVVSQSSSVAPMFLDEQAEPSGQETPPNVAGVWASAAQLDKAIYERIASEGEERPEAPGDADAEDVRPDAQSAKESRVVLDMDLQSALPARQREAPLTRAYYLSSRADDKAMKRYRDTAPLDPWPQHPSKQRPRMLLTPGRMRTLEENLAAVNEVAARDAVENVLSSAQYATHAQACAMPSGRRARTGTRTRARSCGPSRARGCRRHTKPSGARSAPPLRRASRGGVGRPQAGALVPEPSDCPTTVSEAAQAGLVYGKRAELGVHSRSRAKATGTRTNTSQGPPPASEQHEAPQDAAKTEPAGESLNPAPKIPPYLRRGEGHVPYDEIKPWIAMPDLSGSPNLSSPHASYGNRTESGPEAATASALGKASPEMQIPLARLRQLAGAHEVQLHQDYDVADLEALGKGDGSGYVTPVAGAAIGHRGRKQRRSCLTSPIHCAHRSPEAAAGASELEVVWRDGSVDAREEAAADAELHGLMQRCAARERAAFSQLAAQVVDEITPSLRESADQLVAVRNLEQRRCKPGSTAEQAAYDAATPCGDVDDDRSGRSRTPGADRALRGDPESDLRLTGMTAQVYKPHQAPADPLGDDMERIAGIIERTQLAPARMRAAREHRAAAQKAKVSNQALEAAKVKQLSDLAWRNSVTPQAATGRGAAEVEKILGATKRRPAQQPSWGRLYRTMPFGRAAAQPRKAVAGHGPHSRRSKSCERPSRRGTHTAVATGSFVADAVEPPFVNTVADWDAGLPTVHRPSVRSDAPASDAPADVASMLQDTVAMRTVWRRNNVSYEGMREGDFLQAAAEVDELARLTHMVHAQHARLHQSALLEEDRGLARSASTTLGWTKASSAPAKPHGLRAGVSADVLVAPHMMDALPRPATASVLKGLDPHRATSRLGKRSPFGAARPPVADAPVAALLPPTVDERGALRHDKQKRLLRMYYSQPAWAKRRRPIDYSPYNLNRWAERDARAADKAAAAVEHAAELASQRAAAAQAAVGP